MISKQRLIDTFIDLVKIDSPSGHEKELAEYVSQYLKRLKAEVEYDNFGNVIAKLPGSIGVKPLMLNAHLDTVEPGRGIKPIIEGDIIRSDGSTVLGGDPKAGVALILEALTSLVEDKKTHVPLEIVFTREEEIGLKGAINLDYTILTAKRGITFDGEEAVHNVVISAPGYNRVDATIVGRGAHAGAQPEKGISAIQIAAKIISSLHLGRIDHETTANIGLIEGGTARNAIPEKVHFRGEIRSRNKEKLEAHTTHFQNVFKDIMTQHPEAKSDLVIQKEFDSYLFDGNHKVVQHISNVFSDMHIAPNLHHSGGGTDVNIFHSHGIEAIVVGTGDYDAHTTREYVIIPQMLQAAQFCEKIVC